jgi:hypothetical protein
VIALRKHLAKHLGSLAAGGVTLALGAPSLVAQPAPPAMPAPPPLGTAPTAPGSGPPAAATTPVTGYYHYDDVLARTDDDEPIVIHTGPTPELHVVRRGDTLWDICIYYFSDPWQWPKVWSWNGQITNPHWIYPGDLVRLLPKGFLVAPPPEASLEPDAQPTTQPTTPVVVPPSPSTPVEARVRQLAFVDREGLDASMVITGSLEDKELLADGDEVFVSYPKDEIPAVGSRYSIYAEDTAVARPGGGKLGSYVHVLGELQITSVKLDKLAQARIVASSGEIERGARVGPLRRIFKTVPPVANELDLQRTIVARLSRSELIGTGEVVFIDVGEDDGVKVGNRFYVVRRGDALPPADRTDLTGQDDRDFPARALGRVILIDVGKQISVGLVDRAVEEMGIGDRVIMRKELAVDDAGTP